MKPDFLPAHVRDLVLEGGVEQDIACLYMCPASRISVTELATLFMSHKASPFFNAEVPPDILTVPVPSYAPTSAAQAADWSQRYWPISYKNTNPYGPHPSLVGRAEAELLGTFGDGVTSKLELAEKAALEAQSAGIGEGIGCVIVARHQLGFASEEVVAVAADTRWCSEDSRSGPGNTTAHAAMRAIGMVAQKRLRMEVASTTELTTTSVHDAMAATRNESKLFVEEAMTPLESQYLSRDNLAPNGYLCCDLEIYMTHEPCVMCSMAILHSRFSRCVFGKRMPLTGAMTTDETGLGHGLFWRPAELNWKFLCWEWETNEERGVGATIDEKLNV